MSDRPSKLYYTGDGESYPGIPAMDLGPEEIARLSDAKLASIMKVPRLARRALYQVTKPSDREEPPPQEPPEASQEAAGSTESDVTQA